MTAVPSTRRTVLMLALCQALAMTGASIVATTASIIGSMLAPERALSTLPIAVQMTGLMCATIPAALLMARIGRRPVFWAGAALGAVGAAVAAVAVLHAAFGLFCAGTFLLGCYNGVAQQYRFAASDLADDAFRSKAISLVLAGGVVSALFGPETAKWSRDLFAPALFAGCYAMIIGLCLAVAVLLSCRSAETRPAGVPPRRQAACRNRRPAGLHRGSARGNGRLRRDVAGDDCDPDRDARLRA